MRGAGQVALARLDRPAAGLLIVGLGLALRLAALAFLSQTPLFGDARSYHLAAAQIAEGGPPSLHWPPGTPYYLSVFYNLVATNETVGRASVLLVYVCFSLVLHHFVRALATRPAANVAVLIFALYPSHIHFSVEPLTEMLAATFLLTATFLTYQVVRNRKWSHACLLGLAVGFLTLVRPSGLVFAPLVPVYLLVRTRRIGLSAMPCLIAVALVSCWLYTAYNLAGHFVMICRANSANVFIGNNPYTPLYRTWWFSSHRVGDAGVPAGYGEQILQIQRQPEAARSRLYLQAAIGHVMSRPDLFLLRTVNRMRCYFAFDTFSGAQLIKGYGLDPVLGFGVIGLDALFFTSILTFALLFLFAQRGSLRDKHGSEIVLGWALAYALPYWLSFAHPRFHFPVVPLFGIFAAVLLSRLAENPASAELEPIRTSVRRRRGLLLALLLLGVIQIEWAAICVLRL